MTSCCTTGVRRLRGFREGLRASPGEPDSAMICWTRGSALMWPDTGFSGFTLFGLFKKTNSYWKEAVRTVVFYGPDSKETNHLVFLFMRKSRWDFFFLFWNGGLWGERERKHKRETALKTGVFEKALTMQALCCDLVCPHWAEQRNGKDYPQECLGCPQTERAMWLANGREACRAAG